MKSERKGLDFYKRPGEVKKEGARPEAGERNS